ncbi:hypothetical protein VB002_09155 [Campylobacter concisus]
MRRNLPPDELRLNSQLLNLKNVDEEFIALLKELENEFDGVAKSEIESVINSELDTNLAKFKRISDQAMEQISSRLEELKSNGVAKLMSEANNKFEALKQELNDKSKKLKLNFDANDKLEGLKQDIAEFEKKANDKLEDIKQMDIKSEAKKFGDRAYQAAKDFINVIKKIKRGVNLPSFLANLSFWLGLSLAFYNLKFIKTDRAKTHPRSSGR